MSLQIWYHKLSCFLFVYCLVILPSICHGNKLPDITIDESMNPVNVSCSSPLALPCLIYLKVRIKV